MMCIHQPRPGFCYSCSTFVPKTGNCAYKPPEYFGESYALPETIMKHLESTQREEDRLGGPYLQSRKVLLEWMAEIAESLRLSPLTLHSAVYLLDSAVSRFDYLSEQYQPLALIALTLASKTNEVEEISPKISDYSRFSTVQVEIL